MSDTEQEPSIEEILTSIRQIIADDDEDGAQAAPEEQGAAEEDSESDVPDMGEDDVVELTEKLDDDESEGEDIDDIFSDDEPEVEPETQPEPAPRPEPEPIEVKMQDSVDEPDSFEDTFEDDSVLTDQAENAAYDAFSELAKKSAVEHGGITLEEIVRSEIKPLLRGWLDKHLPQIIERLVQEELERVAKRAMDE